MANSVEMPVMSTFRPVVSATIVPDFVPSLPMNTLPEPIFPSTCTNADAGPLAAASDPVVILTASSSLSIPVRLAENASLAKSTVVGRPMAVSTGASASSRFCFFAANVASEGAAALAAGSNMAAASLPRASDTAAWVSGVTFAVPALSTTE